MLDNIDWKFLLVMCGTAVMRLILSPFNGWFRSLASFFIAVFLGLFATDSVLAYFHLDADNYKLVTGILVALTGESIVRAILYSISSPKKTLDTIATVFTAIRGGTPPAKKED
jgi:hypothetical protein